MSTYIKRTVEQAIRQHINDSKVIVLFGARQTGKTTLVRHLLGTPTIRNDGVLSMNGDNPADRAILDYDAFSLESFRRIVGTSRTLFVDEA